MKRVLEIVTYINSGGAEMVIYNYLSHMNRDGLQFDVLALEQPFKPFLEDRFKEMGVGVYYLPTSIRKRFEAFERLIATNKYDIIHAHSEFLCEIYMVIAARYGVKVRIMHSHMANGIYSFVKRIYAPIGKFIAKRTATHFFGCGIDACKSQWGEKAFNQGKCYILNNAIDLKKFIFSSEKREFIRKEMGWDKKHVIMNVGRFMEQKNHTFLIDIYKAVHETRKDTLLVLVGEGPLFEKIKRKVTTLGLENAVQFLGRRSDVPDLLNAADVFLLPSLFEGLPIVSVESQANGLPIVMSEGVTRESGITDIASFVKFDAPMNDWVIALTKAYDNVRSDYWQKVREKNFDLDIEANKLREFYLAV